MGETRELKVKTKGKAKTIKDASRSGNNGRCHTELRFHSRSSACNSYGNIILHRKLFGPGNCESEILNGSRTSARADLPRNDIQG